MTISDLLLSSFIKHRLPGFNSVRRVIGLLVDTEKVEAKTTYGSRFWLRPDDYIDRTVLRDGYYESEVLEELLVNLPTGAVVWDIGANFGIHAVTLKLLRPDVEVVCFEPAPSQADRISSHCLLNNITVEVVRVALGDTAGTAKLHQVDGNAGMSTLVPWEKAKYSSVIDVPVETGDSLVDSGLVPAPSVIKIDIEGSEHAAFRGMSSILHRTKMKVIFEGGQELVTVLSALGFTDIRPLQRKEATFHQLNNYCSVSPGASK